MINYVLNPNLPFHKVRKIICGTYDPEILTFFSDNKIDVFSVESNADIDCAVSLHADMAALHLGGNKIIIDKKQVRLKLGLEKSGFAVYETTDEIKGKYPNDIKLNFSIAGDYIVGNIRLADNTLLEFTKDKKHLNVRQGYSKCSTLIVSERAIITDDEGIYSEMSKNGFDALLISKGDISLVGHNYGFIGGASGKISNDTVLFFGDVSLHRDYRKISSFLVKHGCNYLCTDKGQLRDIGGIIPLTEE